MDHILSTLNSSVTQFNKILADKYDVYIDWAVYGILEFIALYTSIKEFYPPINLSFYEFYKHYPVAETLKVATSPTIERVHILIVYISLLSTLYTTLIQALLPTEFNTKCSKSSSCRAPCMIFNQKCIFDNSSLANPQTITDVPYHQITTPLTSDKSLTDILKKSLHSALNLGNDISKHLPQGTLKWDHIKNNLSVSDDTELLHTLIGSNNIYISIIELILPFNLNSDCYYEGTTPRSETSCKSPCYWAKETSACHYDFNRKKI